MRLHRLELTAFGPYPDTAVVDFDVLGADGLFLLYGETGAGKTSLLDAVAYALFGQVPGARQDAKRLRCDHADPSTAPKVQLELTLAGRRLRIARSPEWQRPKLRGEGTTKEQARSLLEEERDGEWHGVSTRVDEVSHQLQDWLGMSADQFFQVALLPQGEFARFLRAESTEREVLLERLFGTRRFSEVEKWLADRRRQVNNEVGGLNEQLRGVLSRLCQAAGVLEEPALSEVDAAWRRELVAAAEQAAADAASGMTTAAEVLRAAEAEYERVTTLRRRQQRRLAAEEERVRVEAGRAEQQVRRDRVAAARRAAGVRPLLASWRGAVDAANAALTAAERALVPLRAPALAAEVELTEPDRLRAWVSELRDELSRLAALREDAEELPRALSRLRAVAVERASLAEETERRSARLDVLPGEIEAFRKELAAAERASERRAPLTEQVARVQAQLGAARDHTRGEVVVTALRQRVLDAVDAHQDTRELVQNLREHRLAGMAAELAEGLSVGDPCPVCGGVEHPAPAGADPHERVTEAAEAEAAAAEELRRGEREYAEGELARVERDQARLAGLAGGRIEVDLGVELASAMATWPRWTRWRPAWTPPDGSRRGRGRAAGRTRGGPATAATMPRSPPKPRSWRPGPARSRPNWTPPGAPMRRWPPGWSGSARWPTGRRRCGRPSGSPTTGGRRSRGPRRRAGRGGAGGLRRVGCRDRRRARRCRAGRAGGGQRRVRRLGRHQRGRVGRCRAGRPDRTGSAAGRDRDRGPGHGPGGAHRAGFRGSARRTGPRRGGPAAEVFADAVTEAEPARDGPRRRRRWPTSSPARVRTSGG